MVDSLQDLRLVIQALLVNRHLLGCTLTVDLLHGPGRRIQLSHSRIHLNIYMRVSCLYITDTQTWKLSSAVAWETSLVNNVISNLD